MATDLWSLAADGAASALAATGATVERHRTDAVRTTDMPFLNLWLSDLRRVEEHHGSDLYEATLEIGMLAAVEHGASIEAARTDLLARVIQAMSADPTLGGTVQDNRFVETNLPEEAQDAGALYSDWDAIFRLYVETKEGDPFTAL